MARLKLTTAAVKRINPPDKGQIEYFDGLLPSFGLRVSYSGTKAWFVMTRVNGKLIRMTVGRFPAMGLQDARDRAREIIELAAGGIDPRRIEEDRRRRREIDARNTFEVVAHDFMDKHVRRNLRPSTAREYQRILFGPDTQAWRLRPLSKINKRDVLDVLDQIDARGAKSASTLSLAYLRGFFNWCAKRELIEISPTDRIQPMRSLASRDRVLTTDELELIWQAFDDEAGLFGSLFKVLLLTGQRRGEVAGMRWDELRDFGTKAPLWKIPGSRTKNHRPHFVPLAPLVVEIISAAPKTGEYVYSTTGETAVSGFSKAKARIDRGVEELATANERPPMTRWTLHDLRRTMVTTMNEQLAIAPHIVEAVVNHISGSAKAGVAGVYNRALYLDERRIALEQWARWIDQTMR